MTDMTDRTIQTNQSFTKSQYLTESNTLRLKIPKPINSCSFSSNPSISAIIQSDGIRRLN